MNALNPYKKHGFNKNLNRTDLRDLYDMEEMDYKNKDIPEEVAPYAKQIYQYLKEEEVIFTTKFINNPRKNIFQVADICQSNLMSMRKWELFWLIG